MTKDQAIEVLIAHAKRCPEPEPRAHGYPEDIREDYREWRERQAKVNEAVTVLTVPAMKPSAHVCAFQEAPCGECS